ncbi:hypothetical protein NFI96_022415, partial [Prochilodus magdalenae]
ISNKLSWFKMDEADLIVDYTDFANYTYSADNLTIEAGSFSPKVSPICSGEVLCMLLLVINALIFLLGVAGNGVVIWIAGFKMTRTVNTTWYLSLAVSDFIFCASLPFNTIYMATSNWTFGLFMCKFTSFVMFVNMFSSIFLLVVISMDRCVSVIFPVWAQNQRTIGKASMMVIFAWIVAVALSIPSVIYRDVQHHLGISRCLNNYTTSQYSHSTIAMSRFILGFIIPFLIIIVCYSIIIFKLRSNQMAKSTKPFKVMTALIVTFFICWLPYHTFVLFELNQSLSSNILTLGLKFGTSTASANSFLNPILYVFMGNDFRRKFKSSILSKIENAMGEEGRTLSRYLSQSRTIMNTTPETGTEPDYPEYPEYYPDNQTSAPIVRPAACTDAMCVFLAVINVVIFILGVAGNGLVIWIAGCKMKKSVNTTWYLSLAVSDFIFCACLPFTVIYTVKQDWIFGLFMCKFTSFILFLNMFSSIFLLVIISVDRCVGVMFPVWAQNKRTIGKASVIVVLAWIVSAAFSTPSLVFRDVEYKYYEEKHICFNNYTPGKQVAAMVSYRFVSGFLIPFLIIVFCYVVIIQKLRINQSAKSQKPFKIMTALIVTFLICWLPYHIVALMELNHHEYESVLHMLQALALSFASANSCLNPLLYAFMGRDFKRKCYALLSKIESAIEEEGRSTLRGTSFTTSGEGKFSTAV